MLFFHPAAQYRFEIPDAWLAAAGVMRFAPNRPCYVHTLDTQWSVSTVAILQVAPEPGACVAPDFNEQRMVEALHAMATGQPLPPLWCSQDAATAELTLRDGVHRYHAALALRFKQVPVSSRPYFSL